MQNPLKDTPVSVCAVLAVAALVLFVCTYTHVRLGANELSRFITVERLLEASTFSHDHTPLPRSIDAVMVDGKIYSSKPPTYSLALTLTAWPIRVITGYVVSEHVRTYMRTLLVVHQVLPYVFLLWLGWRWVRTRTDSEWVQTVFLLGLSFGCLPYGYAVTLNNHTPTAVFLFCMWWMCGRVLDGMDRPAVGAFVVGLLGGLAASYELTAGIFTPLFGLVLARKGFRYGPLVAAGAIFASIPMFATYYAISGSAVPFYVRSELYDYPGSYWRNPQGMDALDEPIWLYAFHALLGHHGLFSLSPYLLLGWIGLIWQARQRRWLPASVLLGALIVIGYILARTNNYGGVTLGMRWFSQFSPLFAVGAFPVLGWMESRTWGRWICYVLLAVSSAVVFEALLTTMFSTGGWVYRLL
ncbi:MAG: hypothetical protein AAF654_00240 [Myxococcota bacterium]